MPSRLGFCLMGLKGFVSFSKPVCFKLTNLKMKGSTYQEKTKKKMATVVVFPLIKPFPQQKHLVTPLTTAWLMRSKPNADSPYTVDASVPYTQ